MAVVFTPNIGLAKPDESELALNWARVTELAEDNNIIIADKADINLTSYTPSFIGSTTNPNIGSTGTIVGEYMNLQNIIMGNVTVTISGSGISAGSGTYGISLPFPIDNVFHTESTLLTAIAGTGSIIGEGYLSDASAVNTSGTVAIDVATVAGVSYARLVTESFSGKAAQFFTSASPFVMATGDQFSFNFMYRKL